MTIQENASLCNFDIGSWVRLTFIIIFLYCIIILIEASATNHSTEFNSLKHQWLLSFQQAGFSILLIVTVAIGVICGITLGATVWILFSLKMIAVGFLMPFIGYLLGYTMSVIFKQNGPWVPRMSFKALKQRYIIVLSSEMTNVHAEM